MATRADPHGRGGGESAGDGESAGSGSPPGSGSTPGVIVIATARGIGFPNGTAPTARVTGFAQGLRAAGRDVRILCLGTSEPSPPQAGVNSEIEGVAAGIPFLYACGATARSTRFWRRRWHRVYGLLVAIRRLRALGMTTPVDAVLLYSHYSLEASAMYVAARLAGAVYLADVSELPRHMRRRGALHQLIRPAYEATFFRYLDGAVVVSERLRRYVARSARPGIGILKAPVMVDTELFGPAAAATTPDAGEGAAPVVTYCGLLNQPKDGVADLLAAFAAAADRIPGARLQLVGDAYRGTHIPEFRALAERLGIGDRVAFTGNVVRSELPGLLARSTVLVLARPRSPQAEAGMPTKVAEYLASGVPTVLTDVGEMPSYLEHGVSAYLVPPDDVQALAGALVHVLGNPEEAAAVGRRGREVARTHFAVRAIGAEVACFIDEVRARRHTFTDTPATGNLPCAE